MKRDRTHMDFVERWAKFVKENPTKWRKYHKEFINSQFINAYDVIERILHLPNGEEKIRKIYSISNPEACKDLFKTKKVPRVR
jgi:hypothetical protein